ncbi:UNVERIFIED_CONTAM: hypothetical protein RKD50_009425 [Streptomyces canus]
MTVGEMAERCALKPSTASEPLSLPAPLRPGPLPQGGQAGLLPRRRREHGRAAGRCRTTWRPAARRAAADEPRPATPRSVRCAGRAWRTSRRPRTGRPGSRPRSAPLGSEQAGFAQLLQVVGDGRLGDADVGDVAHACFAACVRGDLGEQAQPHRVGQRLEQGHHALRPPLRTPRRTCDRRLSTGPFCRRRTGPASRRIPPSVHPACTRLRRGSSHRRWRRKVEAIGADSRAGMPQSADRLGGFHRLPQGDSNWPQFADDSEDPAP